jgi:hypothetical protein
MSSASGAGKGRGGQPTPLGALLGGTRDAAAQRSGAALDPDKWRRAVGSRIAARTRPGRCHARTLTVYVATAVWAQELSLLSAEMLERVRSVGLDVQALRFRVDPTLGRVARSAELRRPRVPDTSSLPAELTQHLEQITDPELRAAVAAAAASWLGRSVPPRRR